MNRPQCLWAETHSVEGGSQWLLKVPAALWAKTHGAGVWKDQNGSQRLCCTVSWNSWCSGAGGSEWLWEPLPHHDLKLRVRRCTTRWCATTQGVGLPRKSDVLSILRISCYTFWEGYIVLYVVNYWHKSHCSCLPYIKLIWQTVDNFVVIYLYTRCKFGIKWIHHFTLIMFNLTRWHEYQILWCHAYPSSWEPWDGSSADPSGT